MPGSPKGAGHFFDLRIADKKSVNRTKMEHFP